MAISPGNRGFEAIWSQKFKIPFGPPQHDRRVLHIHCPPLGKTPEAGEGLLPPLGRFAGLWGKRPQAGPGPGGAKKTPAALDFSGAG